MGTSRPNHLVSAKDKRLRETETERICCLEIKNQLKFRWLLDRKIGGVRTFKNFIYVGHRAMDKIG